MKSQSNGEHEKKMSLFALVMQCIGYIIGGGIFTILPVSIGFSGRSASLALLIALLFGLLLSMPFLFLSSTIQLDGGYYTQAMLTLPRRLGGTCTLMMLLSMIGFSAYPISMANYIVQIMPFTENYQKIVALIILIFFFALGLFGTSVISKAQNFMVILLLISLGIFIVGGLPHVQPDYFTAPNFFLGGTSGLMGAVGLLTMATVGGSSIINYSKVAKNPKRDIPLAILLGMLVVAVFYLLIAVVATGVAPIEELMGYTLSTAAEKFLSRPLYVFFVIGGALFALGSSFNSVLGYLPYPFVQCAKDGWLPKVLCKETSKGYYWVLMLVLFLIAGCGPVLFGLPIETAATFFALPSYVAQFFLAIACFSLPKKFKTNWSKSIVHVPNAVLYPIIILSALSALYLVYNMVSMMGKTVAIVGVLLAVLVYLYCTILDKKHLVHTEYLEEMKKDLM